MIGSGKDRMSELLDSGVVKKSENIQSDEIKDNSAPPAMKPQDAPPADAPKEDAKGEEGSSLKESQPNKSEAPDVKKQETSDTFGEIISTKKSEEGQPNPDSNSKFGDNDALTYMNEKFGQSFKSIDDVSFGAAEDPYAEISPAAKALDKYLKSTGRSVIDFVNTQAIDFDKMGDREILITDMMNKGYSQKDAVDTYDFKYGDKGVDDMMTDDEVATIEKDNRMREIQRGSEARNSRTELNKMKENYKSPLDSWSPPQTESNVNELSEEDISSWRTNAEAAITDLSSLEIPIGNDRAYKVSLQEYFDGKKGELSDISEVMSKYFTGSDERLDAKKFIEAIAWEENKDKILRSVASNAYQMGQKDTANLGKNPQYDSTDPKRGDYSKDSDAKRKFDTQLEEVRRRSGAGGTMGMKR